MKKCVALLMVLFAPCVSGYAEEVSNTTPVEELMVLMKVDQTMQQMFEQVTSILEQRYTQMGASEAMKPILDKYTRKCLDVTEQVVGYQALKGEYAAIYQQAFTEEELKEILSFYKSPAGRVMVDKLPVVMKQTTEMIRKHTAELDEKLSGFVQEYELELQNAKDSPKALETKQDDAAGT